MRTVLRTIGAALIFVLLPGGAGAADIKGDLQLLQSKPDVTLTGNFDFNARPDVVASLLKSPLLLARLWEAHDFTPRYKARMQGQAIHVDDPTGIQGDLYVAEAAANRTAFVGYGNLNHKLVPAFGGRMAIILNTAPKGPGMSAKIDLYIRTESRILGFLASSLFPLLRTRVEHRMNANAADIGTILAEVSSSASKAAARLKPPDSAALLQLFPPPPPPKPAQAAPAKKPAAKPAAKPKPKK